MKSSVNKFGHIRGVHSKMGPPGVGFHLTADGDYDIQQRLLSNVKNPVSEQDAVNVNFLKERAITDITDGGEFNAMNRRLENVGNPKEKYDAVNLEYLSILLSQTLHLKQLQYWDAKTKPIKNVADPVELTDAVTMNMMKRFIKVHEYFVMKEMADLAIKMREDLLSMIESAEKGDYTAKAKTVRDDLISIKGDHKRTWKWAFHSKDDAVKSTYNLTDRKQISNHLNVDLNFIDEYLKVDGI